MRQVIFHNMLITFNDDILVDVGLSTAINIAVGFTTAVNDEIKQVTLFTDWCWGIVHEVLDSLNQMGLEIDEVPTNDSQ